MNKIEEINFETDPNLQGSVQLTVQSFSFTWTLNYLGASQKSISRRYFSPFLHAGDSTWEMHLIVVAKNDSEAKTCEAGLQNQVIFQPATNAIDEIIIYIARHGYEKDSCYVKYKISLLNDEGCIATTEGEEFRKWIDCSFQSKENNMFSSLMKKDTMFVRCELTTLFPAHVNPASTAMKCSSNSLKVSTKYVSSNCMLSAGLQQSINSRPVKKYVFRHFNNFIPYLPLVAVVILLLLLQIVQVDPEGKIGEMNDYIIDSALKMHDIARALNLTELEKNSHTA